MKDMKKRYKYILLGLIIPLILASLIIGILFYKYGKVFFPKETTQVVENNDNQAVDLPLPITPTEIPKDETPSKEEKKDEETKKNTTPKPTAPDAQDWWEYPTKIKTTTRSGNDLLVLVNKEYKLPSSYAPSDLILAEKSGIRVKSKGTYYIRKELKNHLTNLNNAAKAEGIDISIISAYRSYATQQSTYNYWVKYNNGCVSCADKVSARAGHSQHQLGTAVDFGTKENGDQVGSSFDNTKAAKWLAKNAYKYGFVIGYPKGYEEVTGYSFESWHYRYIGVENALEMVNSGKILEKWLKSSQPRPRNGSIALRHFWT